MKNRNKLLETAIQNLAGLPISFPFDGKHKSCGTDLISRYAWQLDNNPGFKITGCPQCHKSFCD